MGLSCTSGEKGEAVEPDGDDNGAATSGSNDVTGGTANSDVPRAGSGGQSDTGEGAAGGVESMPTEPGVPDDSGGAPNAGPAPGGTGGLSSPDGEAGVGGTSGETSTAGAPGSETPGSGGTPNVTDAGPPAPPLPPDRPTLVVSGVDDYWREEEPLEVANGTPNVTVDEDVTYQTWSGFGGAFTESGWEVLSLLDAAERRRAIELLFDAHEGAHFVWGRVPIGADGYALERYTHNETISDYEMENFSIARDEAYLIPYIEAAREVAPDLRLWAVPWTPPTWMKNTGDFDRGSINASTNVLWAYALYLARFVEEYQAAGIDIEALHVQASPGFEFDFPSCRWDSAVMLSFVRDHLVPTLLSREVDVELWLGTFTNIASDEMIALLMGDPIVAESVRGFGMQWETSSLVPDVIQAYGWPVMQTEHMPGNFPFILEGFNPNQAPNDHGHAVESWDFIRSWVTVGVNSYSAWNMVLDTVGTDLDVVNPWPKSALLVVDRETRTLHVTPAYYVFRHLSYFIDPGAVRLGTEGADALAFENPDGSIVTVLFNPETEEQDVALGVKGTVLEFTVPGEGWATLHWQ